MFPKADGLAIAMTVAAVLTLPLGILGAGSTLLDPRVLMFDTLVAVLSSAVPYSLELSALRRLSTSTYAMLMSLAPAVATLVELFVLRQPMEWMDIVGISLVVAASAAAMRMRSRSSE